MITALWALAAAQEPDWALLDTATWEPAGARASAVGEVALRRATIDGVGCVEGRVAADLAPAELLALTDDLVSTPAWSSAPLRVSEELARDEAGFLLLQVADSPGWTLTADRWWLVRGEPDPVALRYRWRRADPAPHAEAVARLAAGAVEVPVNWGEWAFTATPAGADVRYRGCTDLGGRVPDAVQRWYGARQVPDLVAELIVEARRRAGR